MQFSNDRILEFVRFCIVGIIATIIHYGIYLLLLKKFSCSWEIWTNVAYSIGFILSWCCNLYLSAHFTFRAKVSIKKGIGFALSHGVNYLLHLLFLNIFLWVEVPEKWAPIPVFCLVVPINFLLVRYVFTSKYFQNKK